MLKTASKVYVSLTQNKGYGVFALKNIKAGETIDECVAIKTNLLQQFLINLTRLNQYWYCVGRRKAIVLGIGMLLNHSENPNADFEETDYGIKIFALRDIKPYEEIEINYGVPLWF